MGVEHINLEPKKNEIISDYKRGKPVSEIGRKFNTSETTIFNRLKRWGANITSKKKLPEEVWQAMIFKYMRGESIINLAKEFNISSQPIINEFKRRGIKIRGAKIKPTKEETDRFKYLWTQTRKTREEIGKIMGWSVPSVKRFARKLNLPDKLKSPNIDWKIRVDNKIKELYPRGKSTKQISDALDGLVSEEYIRKRLSDLGLEARTESGLVTKSQKDAMRPIAVEMYREGAKLEDIKKRLGIGRKLLDNLLKEAGVERDRNPETIIL